MTLAGRLDLDSVEDLAACTDQICRSAVLEAVFDVSGLTTVDEAGARTLVAAFRCLASHSVVALAEGIGLELQAMLDRLGVTLPVPACRSADTTTAAPVGVVPAPWSAGLGGPVGLAVTRQRATDGLGVGYAAGGDGSHDRVELPDLLRGDPVEQRPPDLLDV